MYDCIKFVRIHSLLPIPFHTHRWIIDLCFSFQFCFHPFLLTKFVSHCFIRSFFRPNEANWLEMNAIVHLSFFEKHITPCVMVLPIGKNLQWLQITIITVKSMAFLTANWAHSFLYCAYQVWNKYNRSSSLWICNCKMCTNPIYFYVSFILSLDSTFILTYLYTYSIVYKI